MRMKWLWIRGQVEGLLEIGIIVSVVMTVMVLIGIAFGKFI